MLFTNRSDLSRRGRGWERIGNSALQDISQKPFTIEDICRKKFVILRYVSRYPYILLLKEFSCKSKYM